MSAATFDALTRTLAEPMSRRAVAKRLGAIVGGSALGVMLFSTASAHEPIKQACARLGQTPGGNNGPACCPGLVLDPYTNTCVRQA